MVNIEMAKTDPASIFKSPHDVVDDKELTRDQKIDILRRWAYDERELSVAEEENMTFPGPDIHNKLDEILRSLLELGYETGGDSPNTKHG